MYPSMHASIGIELCYLCSVKSHVWISLEIFPEMGGMATRQTVWLAVEEILQEDTLRVVFNKKRTPDCKSPAACWLLYVGVKKCLCSNRAKKCHVVFLRIEGESSASRKMKKLALFLRTLDKKTISGCRQRPGNPRERPVLVVLRMSSGLL